VTRSSCVERAGSSSLFASAVSPIAPRLRPSRYPRVIAFLGAPAAAVVRPRLAKRRKRHTND
jgi:hypothetical protein